MTNDEFAARLKIISEKYYPIIIEHFSQYIDFSKIEDMTTNIFLIEKKDLFLKHRDMKNKRGKCEVRTGFIYINVNKFPINNNLVVHEYLHRISRIKIKNKWCLGIATDNNATYSELNELLTEKYTVEITQQESDSPYSVAFKFFEIIYQKIPTSSDVFEKAYITGDTSIINSLFTNEEFEIFLMIIDLYFYLATVQMERPAMDAIFQQIKFLTNQLFQTEYLYLQ